MTFVVPQYGSASLSDVLPSVRARLLGQDATLPIPAARKYVIVLVDGLGDEQLGAYAEYAECLDSMPKVSITCGVPSTTAVSLTSLGCGHAPGEHGVVGYTFVEPSLDTVVHALTWHNGPEDIEGFRQVPTVFQHLRAEQVSTAAVTLARFANSAITQLGFAGTELRPRPDEEAEPEVVAETVREALVDHDVVYCYERLLDFVGHGHGVGSWQWLAQLERVDAMVAALNRLASEEVCVLITGDHGMLNVPFEHRLTIEESLLADGVRHVAGEGRFRQIAVDAPREAQRRWARFLGERATVLRREEGIEAGWFGALVTATTAARLGDLLVAMHDDWALMSTQFEKEFGLVGMHGSLTSAEMMVPLVMAGGVAPVRHG